MAVKKAIPEYFGATVRVFFEADHIACAFCPLLETYSRKQCRMTGCYIVDDRVIDCRCPFFEDAVDFQTNYEVRKIKGRVDE